MMSYFKHFKSIILYNLNTYRWFDVNSGRTFVRATKTKAPIVKGTIKILTKSGFTSWRKITNIAPNSPARAVINWSTAAWDLFRPPRNKIAKSPISWGIWKFRSKQFDFLNVTIFHLMKKNADSSFDSSCSINNKGAPYGETVSKII